MNEIELKLEGWKKSLLPSFEIAGLYARNPIAHKWKAPFRALLLRECVFWRLHDLLEQSYTLHQQSYALGARILLRSGFETLAALIRINQLMRNVVDGSLDFHEFDNRTCRMLLGSKNKTTSYEALNVNSIMQQCAKRYDWIEQLYGELSESAHPNHEGLCIGYSKIGQDTLVACFANKWHELYSAGHVHGMLLCIDMFEHEYDDVWPTAFAALEKWMGANDARLEATKDGGG